MRFAIKALGDYTRVLPKTLAVGDPVRVEGPYGRFDFDHSAPHQIWVAGGIGLTPFIARMEALAAASGTPSRVDLFYSTREISPTTLARVRGIAANSHVALHVTDTRQDPSLDAAAIVAAVPDWREASIWFCGPASFGDALEAAFCAAGLAPGRLRREAFEFR